MIIPPRDRPRLPNSPGQAWQPDLPEFRSRLDTLPRHKQNRIWNCTEGPMGPQEHKVERRLAAIFAADVAGYSRLMETG